MKECFEVKQHKTNETFYVFASFSFLYLTFFLLPEDIFGIICSVFSFSFKVSRFFWMRKKTSIFWKGKKVFFAPSSVRCFVGISENPIFLLSLILTNCLEAVCVNCLSFLLFLLRLRFPLDLKTHNFISLVLFVRRIFHFFYLLQKTTIDYLSVLRLWPLQSRVEFELWFDFRVIRESTKT